MAGKIFKVRIQENVTHSLTGLALKSALAGGGIVEAVSPLRRPLWPKCMLSLDGRTAHVIRARTVARART